MLFEQCLFWIIQTTLFIEVITLDMDILGISRESCRFELHTSSLSWDKAYQACKQRGMTLASLSDKSELSSLLTVVKEADQMYSQSYSLESSGYWVGLRKGLGRQQFHWGDCSTDLSVTNRFSDLNNDRLKTTACGFFSKDSLILGSCYNLEKGFICEYPSGSGPCFTTLSAIPSMEYDDTSVLTSSLCASSCLSDLSCAGIYVSKETECTFLTYKSQMKRTLAASNVQSTHIFHKRLLYQSSYNGFKEGLTENDLCLIPITSPIVTTQIPREITTSQINPTPALNTRERDTHLETASNSCSNASIDCIAQLQTLSNSEEQSAAQSSQIDNLVTYPLNMTMKLNNQSRTVNNSALSVVFDNETPTLNTSEVTEFTAQLKDTEFTTLSTTIDPYTRIIADSASDNSKIFGTLSTTVIPYTQTAADTTLDDYDAFTTFHKTSLLHTSTTDSIKNSDNHSSTISVVDSGENVTTKYLNATGDMPLFNSSLCFCICKETNETLQEKLQKISSNLKLDKSSLSSVLRRKVSADDPRPSVRYVGSLGIVVLFLYAAVIICCDSPRFIKLFKRSNRKVI